MSQFILFLLGGGIAAGLNWASRFVFSLWMPFSFAVVAAFFVGLVAGFLIMRVFVFDGEKKPVAPQALIYVVINLFALAQTLLISLAMVKWVLPAAGLSTHAEAIGHLTGVLAPVATSYFGHKFFTFR